MTQPKEKILLIRMLGLGDVTCIGVPALRFVRSRFPDAELTFLTFGVGEEVIQLAEPSVEVISLKQGEWPENIVHAMQSFLALAEVIVSREFTQIINLDTWFMPCFLSRFLKDAGEPVVGNVMSMPVAQLLSEFQSQTLSPDYVNNPENYMQSSWLSMHQWHTRWWESPSAPDGGYPEFYLKRCCSFADCDMDMSIDVVADTSLKSCGKPVISLNTQARTAERGYPFTDELIKALEAEGFVAWTGFDGSISMQQTLAQLKSSDLLITVPSAPQWLAHAVNTPSLVISGMVDPRTLMPDYATDMSELPVSVKSLVEGVKGILTGDSHA